MPSLRKLLHCVGCGAEYDADKLMNLCPVDGRPLEIVLDLERLQAEQPEMGWYHPERKDMWRFGGLLPLDISNSVDRKNIVTLGEGCTPLLDYSDHPLAISGGFSLGVKEEGKSYHGYGANPTQSFKDRGMSMTASMARYFGVEKLAVPTQGNAGDSLCEYGVAAGMGLVVAMPDNTPMPILGKIAAIAQQNPKVHLELVEGTIREAGLLLKQKWIPDGYFSVATFQEPGWRIDGKKTLGLELAEPQEPGGQWLLPDVLIYPTGGGTGVLGMWKAFDELEALGLVDDRRPRIVCVQAESTPPLVTAFEAGLEDTTPVDAGETLAYGLNVPGGVGHSRVLEIIRESDGVATAVSEQDIHRELSKVWQQKRWWICPEGAACLAAIPSLLDQGVIKSGDNVVAFNTGSLEKYLPDLRHLL